MIKTIIVNKKQELILYESSNFKKITLMHQRNKGQKIVIFVKQLLFYWHTASSDNISVKSSNIRFSVTLLFPSLTYLLLPLLIHPLLPLCNMQHCFLSLVTCFNPSLTAFVNMQHCFLYLVASVNASLIVFVQHATLLPIFCCLC